MKELTLREIQKEEFKILKDITKLLDKHNIIYYLTGGTLLGAIRHKGFIPWDDDIDICIHRKDYLKFIEICQSELKKYEVKCPENNNLNLPIIKIINKNIEVESNSCNDKYLWIDIFPIDELPNDKKYQKKIINKMVMYKGVIYLKTTPYKVLLNERKKITNRLIKCFLKTIILLFPTKYFVNRINKTVKNVDIKDSKYKGAIVWGYGMKEIFPSSYYDGYEVVEFEKDKFKTYKFYEQYLKQIYGDYKKLPSEEERITHNIKAYKRR